MSSALWDMQPDEFADQNANPVPDRVSDAFPDAVAFLVPDEAPNRHPDGFPNDVTHIDAVCVTISIADVGAYCRADGESYSESDAGTHAAPHPGPYCLANCLADQLVSDRVTICLAHIRCSD